MKIDMSKKYTISGIGLATLCNLIPEEELEFQEEILSKCVTEEGSER